MSIRSSGTLYARDENAKCDEILICQIVVSKIRMQNEGKCEDEGQDGYMQ